MLVIVDYCIPQMDGQEVATKMRRLRPQATIIHALGIGVCASGGHEYGRRFRAQRPSLATELLQVIEANVPIDG